MFRRAADPLPREDRAADPGHGQAAVKKHFAPAGMKIPFAEKLEFAQTAPDARGDSDPGDRGQSGVDEFDFVEDVCGPAFEKFLEIRRRQKTCECDADHHAEGPAEKPDRPAEREKQTGGQSRGERGPQHSPGAEAPFGAQRFKSFAALEQK